MTGPATREGRWRGGLPEPAIRALCSLFEVREYTLDDGCRVRGAKLPSGGIVIDPVDAMEQPDAWRCVQMHQPPAAYDLYRRGQVLAHIDAGRLGWRWHRNQFQGRPAYIVGSGPSAARAQEEIPRRGQRRGLVFAINNSAKLFPGDHDFWCCGDALWPKDKQDWQRNLLEDWSAHDHAGAWGLFHAYANARAVAQFEEQGGVRSDFYCGWNVNPYREMALAHDIDLPGMTTGLQAIVEVIHAAAWLGCGPICLFGVDQGRQVDGTFHGVPSVGWRSGTMDSLRWTRHPGLGGDVETAPELMVTAMILSAQAAWLHDAGIPVFNCSNGLDMLFAMYLDPAEALALCEAEEEPTIEEAQAMTPSLGKRAREPRIILPY